MAYVQGFLLPVPNANKGKYTEMAEMGSRIFKKNGALSVFECWGDDVPDGEVTSFPDVRAETPASQSPPQARSTAIRSKLRRLPTQE